MEKVTFVDLMDAAAITADIDIEYFETELIILDYESSVFFSRSVTHVTNVVLCKLKGLRGNLI